MRLSTAIALGRTAVTFKAGTLLDGQGSGCALGMAGVACGAFSIGGSDSDSEKQFTKLEKAFPWAVSAVCKQGPCNCPHVIKFTVSGVVAHIFDTHIVGRKDWTLDQLIDWVRSVEPPELEETANGDRNETSAATEPVCAKQD